MNNAKPGQVPMNLNINLNDIEAMKCNCGCNIFIHFSQLKFISAFYTGTGQAMQVEMSRFVCTNPNCGLMYEKAMDSADVKKYARNPNRQLFNWSDFFITGVQLIKNELERQQNEKENG